MMWLVKKKYADAIASGEKTAELRPAHGRLPKVGGAVTMMCSDRVIRATVTDIESFRIDGTQKLARWQLLKAGFTTMAAAVDALAKLYPKVTDFVWIDLRDITVGRRKTPKRSAAR